MKKLFLIGLLFLMILGGCSYLDFNKSYVFSAQHDYVVGNAPGVTVRTDINNALQAIATNNAGATEPSPTYPDMWWYDTSTGLLKRRSNANDAWIVLGLEAADTDGTLAANSDSKVPTQKATKTYADTKMSKSGAEAIAGVKTFSSSPIVPTPTTDYQASTKKYVADTASSTLSSAQTYTNNAIAAITPISRDYATGSGTAGFNHPHALSIVSVAKTITSGKVVFVIATGYLRTSGPTLSLENLLLQHGSTTIQAIDVAVGGRTEGDARVPFTLSGIVTGLSGQTTFSVSCASAEGVTGYANITVLEF